jgi:uncharacterized protein (TIGR00369 family)
MPNMTMELAQKFIETMPHFRALGMNVEQIGNGTAVISMPYDEKLIGNPQTGVIHGGAVSALMDTCCGTAVMSHRQEPLITATLDLRIDYMRAAMPGHRITARAECYHTTRSVAFVRAVATDEDTARPVATATGAFMVEPADSETQKAAAEVLRAGDADRTARARGADNAARARGAT